MNLPEFGQKVVTQRYIERFPAFCLGGKDYVGVVVYSDQYCIAVRMKDYISGAEGANNEVVYACTSYGNSTNRMLADFWGDFKVME